MATTNKEIILSAMLLAELDPESVIVDTFAGWKRKGYQVQKGQKAVFSTKIWKPCKVKPKDAEEGEEQTVGYKRLYLVPASFFTNKQVERIEVK